MIPADLNLGASKRKYNGVENSPFSEWLKTFNFDTFATFTTGDLRSEEEKQQAPLLDSYLTLGACRRMANRFSHEFPELTMFWAAEPFSVRKGYHFHALLKTYERGEDVPLYERRELFNYWTNLKRFGRSDFQPIEKQFRKDWTSEYMTKYMGKGLADYDIITPSHPAEKVEYVAYAQGSRATDVYVNYKSKARQKALINWTKKR